jgi:transcriptional regulator with XRE-family HTH domain
MTLNEARFRQKKTQYALMAETGIHQSRISLLERGYVSPTDREIRALTKVLRVDEIDFPKISEVNDDKI